MKTLNHSELESNFHEVENCNVVDNNGNKSFIGSEKDSYSFSDEQDSIHMREFDNGKVAYMDYHGCCYVSELSMSEEMYYQLEQIIDNNGISAGNNFIFDSESLLEKFPEHSDMINTITEILN